MSIGVSILGSTGSIGQSTLRVLQRQPDRFHVVALTAHGSDELLRKQAVEVGASYTGLVNGGAVPDASPGIGEGRGVECLIEAATHPDAQIVVNAIVGAAGLAATLAALSAGKRVALANKETLVMAGNLVLDAAQKGGGEVVPVDSEHSAVLQCLGDRPDNGLRRLVLTASGGPFREWPLAKLSTATAEDALQHPTWSMGPKITVDSATLANKALEVIEAHYLFGLGYDDIDVVVHPQSIVHALTEFVDGSVLAQVGFPTMELPILYALTHPERVPDEGLRSFDPIAASPLTFEPVRRADFPAFTLGVDAGRECGTAPAAFNAANEIAVQSFLEGLIPFGKIAEIIDRVLQEHVVQPATDIETILESDRWARERGRLVCS